MSQPQHTHALRKEIGFGVELAMAQLGEPHEIQIEDQAGAYDLTVRITDDPLASLRAASLWTSMAITPGVLTAVPTATRKLAVEITAINSDAPAPTVFHLPGFFRGAENARYYGVDQLTLPVPLVSAYDTEVLADSPLAYYKLDETSGLVMIDSSGNANDGTHELPVTLGSPPLVNDGQKSATYSGSAGSFSNIKPGVMDIAGVTATFTAEAWFKTVDTTGPIIAARGPTGTPIMGIYIGADGSRTSPGELLVLIRDNVLGPIQLLESGFTVDDGVKHHVALVFEGISKTINLYLDSIVVDTIPVNSMNSGITTNDPQIAEDAITNGGAPHFSLAGDVDCVAFYSTNLSAARILAHFNAGL